MPQELQDSLLWVCLGALVLLEQHGKWITSISSMVLLSQGLQNGADILILDDSIVCIDGAWSSQKQHLQSKGRGNLL